MKRYLPGDCLANKSMYWYKADEADKEIERERKRSEAYRNARNKDREEMEQLRKEKEWLLWEVIGDNRYEMFTSGEEEKDKLIKKMQQALKE